MSTDHTLRDALISSSRAHAETDLHRFTERSSHAGTLAITAAGLLLTWLLLPRRARFATSALLTAAGVYIARDWLSVNVGRLLSDTGRCHEPENFEEPMTALNDSLVDLQSRQSFPASDAPASL